MKNNPAVVIVGAGLAGLYAAWRLERMGMNDYLVIEARDLPGGRIASFDADGARFDLGPTWFWPDVQPQLDALVSSLGLARFRQHEAGDTMVERSATQAPLRTPGYTNAPPSMRLAGSMHMLVEALQRTLDPRRILTRHAVRRLRSVDGQVALDGVDGAGVTRTWRAQHVLLAVPPRLAEQAIAFEPALPPGLARDWRATATWMAPHAKYVAVYDTPFWRAEGLSGDARSAHGPLVEIHDASTHDGSAALFGFVGVPAEARRAAGDAALRRHCRAQLVRLFGARAAAPLADVVKDWASDPFTAVDLDRSPASAHHAAPPARAQDGPWRDLLTGVASEWSPQFPGYVAGAIEAAELGVTRLAAQLLQPGSLPR